MSGQRDKAILVVDDEPAICDLLHNALETKGYTVFMGNNGREALETLRRNNIAAVITDIRMPGMDGAMLLKKIKELFPDIPVMIITGYGTLDNAVDMMKQGAADYISKPFSTHKIYETIEKMLRDKREERKPFREIITVDPKMLQILRTIDIVADSNASIFIQGESGTGKELIARAIHERGYRSNKPFVAVNCAALPETLLESELFGYEKGAFTGAISRRIGKFEIANQGTLLLDEVTEMASPLQAKLLRVLQEGEIDRVGGIIPVKIDVRVISTTNRSVEEDIEKGRLRLDLFYRLCVVRIALPPLRERKEDIPLLTNYFLEKLSSQMGRTLVRISEEAMAVLKAHTWRGNVRELKNVVERALLLCRGDVLSARDLFLEYPVFGPMNLFSGLVGLTLRDAERYLIINTLGGVNGNKARAARILGITTRTIRNKLRQYNIEYGNEEDSEGISKLPPETGELRW